MESFNRLLAIATSDNYITMEDTILFLFLSKEDGMNFYHMIKNIERKTLNLTYKGNGAMEVKFWNIETDKQIYLQDFPVTMDIVNVISKLPTLFNIEFRVYKSPVYYADHIVTINSDEFSFIKLDIG